MSKLAIICDLIDKYAKKYPDKVSHQYYDEVNPDIRHISFREDDLVQFIFDGVQNVIEGVHE